LVAEESSEDKVVIKVTTATRLKPPYTAERIRSARFFTMIEDWELESTEQGSLLTKTWRDVKKYKMKFIPMGLMIKRGAKGESASLKEAWDKAAQAR
jgi:hypothetical protein